MMNKPPGVYSTNDTQSEQTRAIDLLPPEFAHRVYPVGRLDAESRGLLLLTNDGELTNQLTHPRYGVAKTYKAVSTAISAPRWWRIFSAASGWRIRRAARVFGRAEAG